MNQTKQPQQPPRVKRIFQTTGGILAVLIVIGMANDDAPQPAAVPAVVAAPAPVADESELSAGVACANALKKKITYPETMRLGYFETKGNEDGTVYGMKGKVHIKNGFGVDVSAKFICIAKRGEGDPNLTKTWAADVEVGV